jgi:hypothetical protein
MGLLSFGTMNDSARRLPWRSIKRSLPRQGQRVIVKLDCGRVRDAYHDKTWYGGWVTGRNIGQCVTGVTHWMPYK